MHLRKHHLSVRPVLGAPRGYVPLQRPQLPFPIATWLPVAQQPEQRLALQGWIVFEQLDNPGPIVDKRVGSRAVGPRLPELARQSGAAFILPHGAHAHTRPRGSLFLSSAFGTFAQHYKDLRVPLHRTPFVLEHDGGPAPQLTASSGSSD